MTQVAACKEAPLNLYSSLLQTLLDESRSNSPGNVPLLHWTRVKVVPWEGPLMSRRNTPKEPATGSVSWAQRLDGICDRFENEWRDGRRPQIESFLHELPEEA